MLGLAPAAPPFLEPLLCLDHGSRSFESRLLLGLRRRRGELAMEKAYPERWVTHAGNLSGRASRRNRTRCLLVTNQVLILMSLTGASGQ